MIALFSDLYNSYKKKGIRSKNVFC